jgi:hypothetical protein
VTNYDDNNQPQSRDPKVKDSIKEVEEMCRKNKLFSNCGDKRLGHILVEALISHDFFGGSAIVEGLQRTKQCPRTGEPLGLHSDEGK